MLIPHSLSFLFLGIDDLTLVPKHPPITVDNDRIKTELSESSGNTAINTAKTLTIHDPDFF